jgi:hypothetical protein
MRFVGSGGLAGFVDAPATGVEAFGVGTLLPFLAFRRWPAVKKFDDTALAPAAAVVAVGAIAA